MASQGPNNTSNTAQVPGQAQMRRDDRVNQPSNIQNQGQTNFLQETGTQVKNMAQGAADVGKGAAQGAVSIARGVALGAANITQGAADAVKNTLGMNNPAAAANTNYSAGNPPAATTNYPGTNPEDSRCPGNHPANIGYPGDQTNPTTKI